MAGKQKLAELKKEFGFLEKEKSVLAVLLFGSSVKDSWPRDTDICIVAAGKRPSMKILKKVFNAVDVYKKKYDVYFFSELPLHLKIQVMQSHQIVFAKSEPELFELFYFYRKLWQEQKHRQEVEKEEILKLI